MRSILILIFVAISINFCVVIVDDNYIVVAVVVLVECVRPIGPIPATATATPSPTRTMHTIEGRLGYGI